MIVDGLNLSSRDIEDIKSLTGLNEIGLDQKFEVAKYLGSKRFIELKVLIKKFISEVGFKEKYNFNEALDLLYICESLVKDKFYMSDSLFESTIIDFYKLKSIDQLELALDKISSDLKKYGLDSDVNIGNLFLGMCVKLNKNFHIL